MRKGRALVGATNDRFVKVPKTGRKAFHGTYLGCNYKSNVHNGLNRTSVCRGQCRAMSCARPRAGPRTGPCDGPCASLASGLAGAMRRALSPNLRPDMCPVLRPDLRRAARRPGRLAPAVPKSRFSSRRFRCFRRFRRPGCGGESPIRCNGVPARVPEALPGRSPGQGWASAGQGLHAPGSDATSGS